MENRLTTASENRAKQRKGGYTQRAGKHVRGVLQAVLVCGMSIQILLGLVWLVQNMGGLQNFQESSLLLAGESAASGFYSGILYRGLALLLGSHPWILYGIQLTAAAIAAYGLMSCFLDREKRALRLLSTLTLVMIPQALQCHLAVLPWSLGTSLLMGETALWRKAGEGFEKQDAARRDRRRLAAAMLLGWLLILLVLPVYAWFVFPMFTVFLWRTGKRGNRTDRRVCALAAFLILSVCVTVNCGWNPAGWNRKLAADALSRVGWPYFQSAYEVFPQSLHEEIGLVTAREVSAYADGVERVLIPRLEARHGMEETTALLWELAKICLRENPKTALKNIIWDMAAYHATPPILAMQLKGRAYDACSGMNYEQMRSRAPLLTRFYVAYGGRWWWMMLGLAALIMACGKSERKASDEIPKKRQGKNSLRSRGRKFLQCWLPVLIGMEWMILNFVLGGSGIMDYKKTLWVTILWYMAVLCQLAGGERRKE